MTKQLIRTDARLHRFNPSMTERLKFSTIKKLPNSFLDVLQKHLVGSNHLTGSQNSSLLAERSHRVRLEHQLAITQVAFANACSDLAEARHQAQHFRFQSLHDNLTTLPNSLSIHECLEAFLKDYASTDYKLAVLFIDIDNFKLVNDVHGHAVGDRVLQIVSARILHSVRVEDRVGRLGGDEFLCLIAHAKSREDTARIAQQIFDAVLEPIQIGSVRLTVHASIGIAFSPDDGIDSDSLIKRADAAMYRAKRSRSVHAFYDAFVDVASAEK
jgi:diguanylate cyclase